MIAERDKAPWNYTRIFDWPAELHSVSLRGREAELHGKHAG
jgi:hypothetical protein